MKMALVITSNGSNIISIYRNKRQTRTYRNITNTSRQRLDYLLGKLLSGSQADVTWDDKGLTFLIFETKVK